MNKLSDQQIVSSWKKNAFPWITAIREKQIESRVLITNKAVVDAVISTRSATCLDVGCGEGWLVRELVKNGVASFGIDIVPELIESARKEGSGKFKVLSYEELSFEVIKRVFGVVVCNFSLLGKESVEHVFKKVLSLLNNNGFFIVQTLHPVVCCEQRKYIDGWEEGSWSGFSSKFSDPAPWYFRTLETWKRLFIENGFEIKEIIEPINPKTLKPASIIFIGVKK